ncbi:hypothetical protein H7Y21_02460 [Arenimonas sp.]|nr:hypothetical protein [Candidatus Parcubacteria bacterium]
MKIDYQKIKKLIKEYYQLENGFHIKNQTNLLRVCGKPEVYISRRALKHFIERRKPELLKNYNLDESIEILISILYAARNVIKHPDREIVEEILNKITYEKVFKAMRNLSIRIVTEALFDKRQIKLLHLIKTKIPP